VPHFWPIFPELIFPAFSIQEKVVAPLEADAAY